jgi:hypothetical protein
MPATPHETVPLVWTVAGALRETNVQTGEIRLDADGYFERADRRIVPVGANLEKLPKWEGGAAEQGRETVFEYLVVLKQPAAAGTVSRAFLYRDVRVAGISRVEHWRFFRRRLQNVAAEAAAYASGGARSTDPEALTRGEPWSAETGARGGTIAPGDPAWCMLAWERPRSIGGIFVRSCARTFRIETLRESASGRRPAEAAESDWKELAVADVRTNFHSPIQAVAARADRVYFGASMAEAGVCFIECDPGGRKLRGRNNFGAWLGVNMLAADGDAVYVAATDRSVYRMDAATRETRKLFTFGGGGRPGALSGMAAHDGTLCLAFTGGGSTTSIDNATFAGNIVLSNSLPALAPGQRNGAVDLPMRTPPEIDGRRTLREWKEAAIPADASGAASFSLGYDDANLCLCWTLRGLGRLRNGGAEFQRYFKTGAALDFLLGTDPAADPKRMRPVRGDLRLLIAFAGSPADPEASVAPRAVLYQPDADAGERP